ncbi:MAG: ATP-binding protein [Coriobacteriia bacterium]|nr:ATP-binding protein [Coriobacteriia bacterium]
MKAITENMIRYEIGDTKPDVYIIKKGCILTTSALDYLQDNDIKVAKEGETLPLKIEEKSEPKPKKNVVYVCKETGKRYKKKPECMTQLHDNVLVSKCSDRICFRGKLDSMQALVVYAQSVIAEVNDIKIVNDLDSILDALREIMRADVLEDDIKPFDLIGMSFDEIHERSHNPQKYYGIEQCKLPDYKQGKTYALLTLIRSGIREAEVAAAKAFIVDGKTERPDIIQALNRLSSAMHVMVTKLDAGEYDNKEV